jgi:hypothetical protein
MADKEREENLYIILPGVIDGTAVDMHSVSPTTSPPQPIRCLVPRHHDEETVMQSVDFGGV